MNHSLSYVRLPVDSYRSTFHFYRDVMRMEMMRGNPDSLYAEFEGGGVRLALFQRSHMAAALGVPEPQGEGRGHVALVFSVDDVDAAHRELESKGAKFIMAPRTHADWRVRTAHLRDPDGNVVEINQRIEAKVANPA